jgi:uncharacterized protein
MGNELLASKVVIVEESPRQRSVPILPTSVCLFVGVTEKGPLGIATQVSGMDEYTKIFGGHVANSYVTAAVNGFFLNGGTNAWIVRTVHYTDVATPATKTSAAATLSLLDRAGTPIATLKVDGKYDGVYAHSLKILIEDASSGDTGQFNLSVVNLSGVKLETFPNLKIGAANASDLRYVETVINDSVSGSNYIAVTDLENATAAPANMPAKALSAVLASGNDGLVGLVDADYVGSAAGQTGIYAGDDVEDLTLLCVPGLATAVVQNAMASYCTVARGGQVFAILDPPANQSATQIITYTGTTAALEGLTESAAMYWPRVKISNPQTSVFGADATITVPPCGHIAGMIARTDSARPGGVYDQPAGIETGVLYGVIGVEMKDALKESKRDLVFPHRINPITKIARSGFHVDGARVLKETGNWPSVGQRRGVSHIQQSIRLSMQVFRHKNRTDDLLAEEKRTVDTFLATQCGLGAFVTRNPKQAYFSDFGKALNPPSKPNITTARIGLATAAPNEFIVLLFSEDKSAYEAAQ